MPSHFTPRMQFGAHQDPEEVTRQLLKLKDEAPVDEVMVFFFAEEMNDGHDTLERIPRSEELTKRCMSGSLLSCSNASRLSAFLVAPSGMCPLQYLKLVNELRGGLSS